MYQLSTSRGLRTHLRHKFRNDAMNICRADQTRVCVMLTNLAEVFVERTNYKEFIDFIDYNWS